MDDRETAWMEQIADLQASLKKVCAERDRYKAALEKIDSAPQSTGRWAMDISREALRGPADSREA